MTDKRASIDSAVLRIWEDVQDKLVDVLYRFKIEPDDPAFTQSVNLWLGEDTYDAFVENWEKEEA
jgi:hypothetical protein